MLHSIIHLNMTKYTCDTCEYETVSCSHFKEHLTSQRHINKICKLPKDTSLSCLKCNNYVTGNKAHFRRHMSYCQGTRSDVIACSLCRKQFKTRSGLFKHEPKCSLRPVNASQSHVVEAAPQEIALNDDMILVSKTDLAKIIQENTPSLEEIVAEVSNVIKEMPPTMQTIDNRQDHRQFNINVFLNEKCKDAMNIMDFARNIQLTYANLDKFIDKGYVDGLSDIIGTGLRNMAITERPMHCSDARRNVLHVKHEGEWQHDEEAMPIALKAVELIRRRHLVLLKSWQNSTPDAKVGDSKAFEQYLEIMKRINGNGARLVNDATFKKRTEKIVKRICKQVKLEKLELEL